MEEMSDKDILDHIDALYETKTGVDATTMKKCLVIFVRTFLGKDAAEDLSKGYDEEDKRENPP